MQSCVISSPQRPSDNQVIALCAVLPVSGIEDVTFTNVVLVRLYYPFVLAAMPVGLAKSGSRAG